MPSHPDGKAPDREQLLDLLSRKARTGSRLRHLSSGEVIVREGEAGANVFVLLAGQCDVSVRGHPVNRVGPGELIGEIAGVGGGTRTATVHASSDSDVLELDGLVLRSAMAESPALLDKFLRALAARVREMSQREASVRDEHRKLRRVLEHLHPSLERFRNHASIRVEVRWEPLSFASGDYYDVLELAPDSFLFALGDVMGHGAPTTPIVGMIRGQLHEAATSERRPDRLLEHLHQHLQRYGEPDVFMTLTLMRLDVTSRCAELALAGPPAPLLCRGGRCSPVTQRFGWTLGYPFAGKAFASESLSLERGDVLFFYTDGLSDLARGPDPERDSLGIDGVCQLVAEAGSQDVDVADAVFAAAHRFRGDWPVEDDATALVVTVR